MHELSYVQEIYTIASKYAIGAHAKKVCKVSIAVSVLSGIEADSCKFYWEKMTHTPLFEQSVLSVKKLPVHITCLSCKKTFIVHSYSDILIRCRFCKSIKTVVTEQTSVIVHSITVEM